MGPKKDDKKKGPGAGQQIAGQGPTIIISEEDLNESKNLPQINDFIFFNFYAFKMNRNLTRLHQHISKQFTYTNPEEAGYSDELAQKFRIIELYQLVAQGLSRGLLNDQEAQDIQKLDPIRRRQILAQATVESVTAFQMQMRQKRKDDLADPSITQEKIDQINQKIDQIIFLKDFPKTGEDVKALVKCGMQKLHSGFLIEEIFSREIESDDEDNLFNSQSTVGIIQSYSKSQYSSAQLQNEETDGRKIEKKFNKIFERAQVFEEFIIANRVAKTQNSDSEIVNFYCNKLKFSGPENPLDIPPPPEEGQEPIPVDEELKAQQFKFYLDFALQFKVEVENIAKQYLVFKKIKKIVNGNKIHLRPKPYDPEEDQKKLQKEEELKKMQAERLRQEEEERKAAEANQKGGVKKTSATTKVRNSTLPSNMSKEVEEEQQVKTISHTEREMEEPPVFFSLDDDPSKKWEFNQYQKNISEMKMGTCTVGSIIGAIVNQLSQNKPQDSTKPEYYQKTKMIKKLSSSALKAKLNSELSLARAEENSINQLFQNTLQKLQVEHSIVETDYKHQFDYNLIEGDASIQSSPYMIVKSANDKMLNSANLGAYKFGDGSAQDFLEQKILQNSLIPGVNSRQGMPEKATLKPAVRQSDQNQIIRFCQLPSAQTKRCLILRACEEMMKKHLKEREFSFLDRNYFEEYSDQNTLRQVLSSAIIQLRPEILTEYFAMDDGLLISLYYKNPPGRLLRRQWTQPPVVFPNFSEWYNHLLSNQDISSENLMNEIMKNRKQQFLDIQIEKVGVIKNNTKFMFPSDNSIIRVEKHQVGQKRMGESLIIKDNFIFGLSEKKQLYDQKVDGEDELRNRDYKKKQDKRCELWLQYENGVRMTIEMQDHLEANMSQLPPLKIANWLKKKIDREEKLKKKLQDDSDGYDNVVTDRQIDAPSQLSRPMDQNSQFDQSPKNESKLENLNQTQNSGIVVDRKTSGMDQDILPIKNKNEKVEKAESDIVEEEDSELQDGSLIFEGTNDLTKGAKISFTFNDGLVVQVLPNGDVLQKIIDEPQMSKSLKKGNNLVQNQKIAPGQQEIMRVITTNGDIIKHIEDGNFIIYMSDGTITYSDKRRGVWYTISLQGVKRERKIKNRIIKDEVEKLNSHQKIDPETNAQLTIREDGLLNIVYIDQTQLIIMPDGTNILKKKRQGEAGSITIITKDGFVPVRQIYDPVKARARTIIGMGGTDALMGKDQIMERSNTGRISEVLLPDQTIVQSYFEKQELEGYNLFTQNMVHIIKREDFSVVKVRQDGEVVLITANERAYLNEIGKQIEEFGTKDYDYFFELFGIANERRSGVYTANLDQGKIWTQDEEGNFFIVYANGDSVEKMSVSFNLDQMVDGIENKEPESPKMKDGEFMEDECKFLPPPKSMAHPRLFLVRNDGTGCEFFNEEQTTHMFRTFHHQKNNQDLIQSQNMINLDNEQCLKHVFIEKQHKKFDAQAFDISNEFPKLPQSLEMVNQTVSIPTEPVVENYTIKNIFEFKKMDESMINEFNQALNTYKELKDKQSKMEKELKIVEPHIITTAAAPLSEKEGKNRSSAGINSNLNQSNNFNNQGSDGGLSESIMLQSISPKQKSPRNFREQQKNTNNDQKNQKATEEIQTKFQEDFMNDDVPIDPETGLQLYKNQMSLSFMQKLQLRIIQDRNIDMDELKGEEFKILKEYKKLEDRASLLNNVYDFFDTKYQDSVFNINDSSNFKNKNNQLNSGQPSAMFLSVSSQKEIM